MTAEGSTKAKLMIDSAAEGPPEYLRLLPLGAKRQADDWYYGGEGWQRQPKPCIGAPVQTYSHPNFRPVPPPPAEPESSEPPEGYRLIRDDERETFPANLKYLSQFTGCWEDRQYHWGPLRETGVYAVPISPESPALVDGEVCEACGVGGLKIDDACPNCGLQVSDNAVAEPEPAEPPVEASRVDGWVTKYHLRRADGTPVAPDGKYFVLNLNSRDPHHQCASKAAALAYADGIATARPLLAEDLRGYVSRYQPPDTPEPAASAPVMDGYVAVALGEPSLEGYLICPPNEGDQYLSLSQITGRHDFGGLAFQYPEGGGYEIFGDGAPLRYWDHEWSEWQQVWNDRCSVVHPSHVMLAEAGAQGEGES